MAWMKGLLTRAASLHASLSQYSTNGVSTYGCLNATTLPLFLSDDNTFSTYPWGNAQPGHIPPNTGKTRYYDLTVSRSIKAPDGYHKSVILINDQFPGPLIEANWGDVINVRVTNNITDNGKEGLSLHWHGQPQKLSPWADGVPSVTQCPIAPGTSFTYEFRAESFGSSWYHSHFSAQYNDGLFGPLVIYGPNHVDHDIDLGPVMLSDYIHESYRSMIEGVAEKVPNGPVFPNVDNNLINGKGNYNCDSTMGGTCTSGAGLSKFKFVKGKKHRLRLINAGSAGTQKFSIDGHQLQVTAVDYVPIIPYTTDVVTLAIGQRVDVVVTAPGESTDAVWMRSDLDVPCMHLTCTNPHGLAAIYYENANTTLAPTTTGVPWDSNDCANDPLYLTTPYTAIKPPDAPSITQHMEINVGVNGSGNALFTVNNSTFRANYNTPLLLLASEGTPLSPLPHDWNIYNFSTHPSIRLHITNLWDTPHPMHLHGHDFFVLAEGRGTWDGSITNPSNPLRRDTQLMRSGSASNPSFIVLEFVADNPGVWPFHCHTSSHVSAGLLVNIFERPDLVAEGRDQRGMIPQVVRETCEGWNAYTDAGGEVDEIDSGLRR
ncbi:1e835798-3258-4733-9ec6-1570fbb8ce24 [Sclerotinia trifoliorum]|uniref:laccase n=1 Tax=Sclerotinia trifoliorum TaxID=28548 RepID=A0A8H2ZPN8_9HELO|nr:1e835798-3258-4733-9ec6-1570fbb8ce24 [Sclerotinia trifoliorum]